MRVTLNRQFIEHKLIDAEMTARDLAEISGVSEPTIYRVMGGKPFRSETLEKVAAALGCSPIDLITAEGFSSPLVDAPIAGVGNP